MFDFPSSPSSGQEFAPSGGPIYVWNGYAWNKKPAPVLSTAFASDDPPSAPDSALWWETNTAVLHFKYNDGNSTQWVQLTSPPVDVTGFYLKSEVDTMLAGKVAKAGDTMSGNLTISAANAQLLLNKSAAANIAQISFGTAGQTRWNLLNYSDGNFYVQRISATGVDQGVPITVAAADGAVTIPTATITNLTAANILGTASFSLTTNVSSTAVFGQSNMASSTGVYGRGLAYGVLGYGLSAGYGVLGQSSDGAYVSILGHPSGYSIYATGGNMYGSSSLMLPNMPTTASAATAHCATAENNKLYRFTSSYRYKTAVETMEDEYGDKVLDLRPIFFRSNELSADDPTWSWFGFGAEDVATIDFRFALYTKNIVGRKTFEIQSPQEDGTFVTKEMEAEFIYGDELIPDGVNQGAILAALVNLVQRQQKRIEALEARYGV